MKKQLVMAALAAAGLFAVGSAQAASEAEMEKMMQTKGCIACHHIDNKLIGPAYRDVAKKYTAKDVDHLVEKVLNGGSGVWGKVPMTPNKGKVSKEEATTLVKWILSLK
jgi:cytochrome c